MAFAKIGRLLLDIPLKSAVPTILLGVIIAGLIITGLTCGVITIF